MFNTKYVALLGLITLLTACNPDPVDPPNNNTYGEPTPFSWVSKPFFPPPAIKADNPLTVEGIELGRHLFFDTKLSGDNTQSCASCHNQVFAFTDNGARFSTGITGAVGTKNSMPMFNLVWQDRFFWDGRAASLREQVLLPIEDPTEMHDLLPSVVRELEQTTLYPTLFGKAFGDESITVERMAKALEQFLFSIVSGDSKFDKYRQNPVLNPLTASETRGLELFMREFSPPGSGRPTGADCFHCHGMLETRYLMAAFGVDNTFLNNGLKADYSHDEGRKEVTGEASDLGKFKVPSTRNIDFSFPYRHDGSIPDLDSLIEVYNFGGHPGPGNNIDPNMKAAGIGRNWTRQQKEDLVAFLKTMTDYDLLQNPDYADPFQ